ncbi:PEP-CTERM sorting domain-containing protein [Paucibacter sp. PLA-PC-4]|uniref:PEP-CTERM sorting domain-containing protein n=1 Tax=Paucibacter sp. PLA-PC-4 TaxID=2993655 RepID=UPI00224A9144|nr:PEP-CTERM sorting domain-containing protein [Paucibacter sp. PLA-PC-4]MCX2863612.1 PEP-CTERM sorting domain-containing protein [Paucibacter sp. PLA-PC-4]
MTIFLSRFLFIGSLMASFAIPASAVDLLGSSVVSRFYALGNPITAPGASPLEFIVDGNPRPGYANHFTVTVTDSQIIYDFVGINGYVNSVPSYNQNGLYIEVGNLLVFSNASPILTASINAATNMAGFSADRLSYNATGVAVNWAGLAWTDQTVVAIDINPAAVPEPSTWLLCLAGIAVLSLCRTNSGRDRRLSL